MNRLLHPVLPQNPPSNTLHQQKIHETTIPFKDMLATYQTNLIISKHAQQRIQERKISLTQETWSKIANKLEEAKTKGVTDALVVVGDSALVVNTKENTVITAMNTKEAKQRVFTNINGTILL